MSEKTNTLKEIKPTKFESAVGNVVAAFIVAKTLKEVRAQKK